jgi:hypothetical protein
LTKYSTACAFGTVNHFCHASSRVRCDQEMYLVGHNFPCFEEHAVLLCRGVQKMLEPLFYFANKNFQAILRAKDHVVGQVEDCACFLDVTAAFWAI